MRDLVFAQERFGPQQKGGHGRSAERKPWRLDAKAAASKAREEGKPAPENLAEMTARYDTRLADAFKAHPLPEPMPKKTRFWRMAKVRQKISGRFRGQDAPDRFCRIRGYLSTLRKQNIDIMTALNALFAQEPLLP